ncbi:hypothetical protein TI39_contig805g00004 [Zymoseptoria brevis]|uniref:Uncharacterized protein n=1 Tax=Zymoseptoria brevis TaxID=1047168 RepID=A0A0F4GFE9_9PEZI|nr:hypothetical protein TI39_contig805g00004 [Zymoseptoria brevis]
MPMREQPCRGGSRSSFVTACVMVLRTALLEDTAIDLDNLDVTFRKPTVIELKDVGLSIRRIAKLTQLPPWVRLGTPRSADDLARSLEMYYKLWQPSTSLDTRTLDAECLPDEANV